MSREQFPVITETPDLSAVLLNDGKTIIWRRVYNITGTPTYQTGDCWSGGKQLSVYRSLVADENRNDTGVWTQEVVLDVQEVRERDES
jgi:hypothetical protein